MRKLQKWAVATFFPSALSCSWESRPDFIFGKGEKINLLWYCEKKRRKRKKRQVNVKPWARISSAVQQQHFRAEIHWLWSLMGKKKDIKGIYCEIMDLIPGNPFFGIRLGILFLWSLELDYAGITNQSMWVALQDEGELWIENYLHRTKQMMNLQFYFWLLKVYRQV